MRILIADAIKHLGRPPNSAGGKAALARALGINRASIAGWKGPYLPEVPIDRAAQLVKAVPAMRQYVAEDAAAQDALPPEPESWPADKG